MTFKTMKMNDVIKARECGERKRPELNTKYNAKQGRQQFYQAYQGKLLHIVIMAGIWVLYYILGQGPEIQWDQILDFSPCAMGLLNSLTEKASTFTWHHLWPLFSTMAVLLFPSSPSSSLWLVKHQPCSYCEQEAEI